MKKSLLFPVACMMLFACSKDAGVTNPNNNSPKLARILVGGNVQSEFRYDGNGRLVTNTGYLSLGIRASESKRYYDASGKLVKIENAFNISSAMTVEKMETGYNELSYDTNGRVAEIRTYRSTNGNPQYTTRTVNEYDASGRLVTANSYDAVSGQLFIKYTYQYNSSDNIVSSDMYQYNTGLQTPNIHYVYEYDSYANPLKDIWVMPYGANKNNISKQTVTTYSLTAAPVTGTHITTYKSYTANGYPAVVNENGTDYLYEYQ